MRYIFLLLMAFSLLGCDKGQKTFDKLIGNFGSVLRGKITSSNVEKAERLQLGMALLAHTYPYQSSGKDAKDVVNELREKARLALEIEKKKLKTDQRELAGVLKDYFTEADKWIGVVKKAPEPDQYQRKSHPEGICLLKIGGRIGDPALPASLLTVNKVVQVGQQDYLLETVVSEIGEDVLDTDEYLKRIGKQISQPKILSENSVEVKCEKLKPLLEALNKYLAKAKTLQPRLHYAQRLSFLLSDQGLKGMLK
ncbi:MAG: hypothetical protein KDD22_04090 [Bdellovibrionales bacterium]|nr:hypothetical protein [Bdellovibrionales bacterium]